MRACFEMVEMGVKDPYFLFETLSYRCANVQMRGSAASQPLEGTSGVVESQKVPESSSPNRLFPVIQGRIFAALFAVVAAHSHPSVCRQLFVQVLQLAQQRFLYPEHIGRVKTQLPG